MRDLARLLHISVDLLHISLHLLWVVLYELGLFRKGPLVYHLLVLALLLLRLEDLLRSQPRGIVPPKREVVGVTEDCSHDARAVLLNRLLDFSQLDDALKIFLLVEANLAI